MLLNPDCCISVKYITISHFFTEPCPPSNVVVGSTCVDDSALVSWSPSLVAETYHVVAMGANGHVHTCNTTSSNCSISELHCGQQYDISVTASRENCTSKASQNATLNTGSCLYIDREYLCTFICWPNMPKDICFSSFIISFFSFLSRSLPARWSLSYFTL